MIARDLVKYSTEQNILLTNTVLVSIYIFHWQAELECINNLFFTKVHPDPEVPEIINFEFLWLVIFRQPSCLIPSPISNAH